MVDLLRRSWAVINLDNIAHNIQQIKNFLPKECMIMGVVKADGYGHGDKYIAETMIRKGVSWLGVSNINEAMSLRNQGIHHPILIFGTTPVERVHQLCEYNITQAIFSVEYANLLQNMALKQDVSISAHIKLDTGMGRLGLSSCDIYYFTN